MTNAERIKLRIERDKERRRLKRAKRINDLGNIDEVFSMRKLNDSFSKCLKGTGWKESVQRYGISVIIKNYETRQNLLNGKFVVNKVVKDLVISERGKTRYIKAVNIDDRVIQRCLCDNWLVPFTSPMLIYDNPASVKGKGVSFARDRVFMMLREFTQQHKDNGYALVFDFSNFFGSIPHDECRRFFERCGATHELADLCMRIVISYQKSDANKIPDVEERKQFLEELEALKLRGITLGSQVSQVLALVIPNGIDHKIKDKYGFKHYLRFMDDGIVLHEDKKVLEALKNEIDASAKAIGLNLNLKKTVIRKLSKGFTFLKVKYFVTESGQIVKRLTRRGIVRERRKLKKFVHLIAEGKMTKDDAYNSFMSWFGNTMIAKSYHTRKKMLRLYNKLFDSYKTEGLRAFKKSKKNRRYKKPKDMFRSNYLLKVIDYEQLL